MRKQCLCPVCRLAVKKDKVNCSTCGSLTHASCLDVRLDRTEVFKLTGGVFRCINCALNDTGFDFGDSLTR